MALHSTITEQAIFALNCNSRQVPVILHTLQNDPSLPRRVYPTLLSLQVEQQGHLCGTRGRHPESPGQPAGHTYLVLHYWAQSTLVLFVWGQADFQQGCSTDQNMQANWMHPVGRWLRLHLQLQATSEKKGYFVQLFWFRITKVTVSIQYKKIKRNWDRTCSI